MAQSRLLKYSPTPHGLGHAFAVNVIGMLIFVSAAFAAQTTLVWDHSPDPGVIGYRLHYGDSSRNYSITLEVDNQTVCTVTELAEGTPYFFAVTAYDGQGNESDFSEEVSQTIYEDAADLTTKGWDFCISDPGGGAISNIYDEDRQEQVIELIGDGLQNCYRLRRKNFADWNNPDQFVIAWSMKYSEPFKVSVIVATTAGLVELRYRPLDEDILTPISAIRYGLGSWAKDGQWHRFKRDLQADFENASPGEKILSVKRLLIRGSGRLTDIRLSTPGRR